MEVDLSDDAFPFVWEHVEFPFQQCTFLKASYPGQDPFLLLCLSVTEHRAPLFPF